MAERETGERREEFSRPFPSSFPASFPALPQLSLASLDFLARVTILRDCSQSSAGTSASMFFFPHTTPLRWRSINRLLFIFYHQLSRRTLKRKQRVCEQAIVGAYWNEGAHSRKCGVYSNSKLAYCFPSRISHITARENNRFFLSLRASSPIWASEASLAKTRE